MNRQRSFAQQAPAILRARREAVVAQALADELGEAYWHPYGFAVFHIGEVAGVGDLRFHVWPVGVRKGLKGHATIHCHDWDLVSLVVAGTYRDVLFQARISRQGIPLWRVATSGRTVDSFERADDRALAIASEVRRTCTAGDIHVVAAGTFHRSAIRASDFCATLLLTSRGSPSERMIAGSPARSLGRRKSLSGADRRVLARQFGTEYARVGNSPQ